MNSITKEDIRDAFKANKRKRLQLLYLYYREELFDEELPADHLAKVISKDLRMKITSRSIYNIKKHYFEPDQKSDEKVDTALNACEIKETKEKSNDTHEIKESQEKKKFTFSDPDPSDSYIRKQLAPLLKKKNKDG